VYSPSEPCLDLVGVPRRLLLQIESVFPPTTGEGSGVKSAIAARYGLGKFDPKDSEDVRLVVETFDRSDEVVGGRCTGEVTAFSETASSTGGLAL
jgi:hypothetical protein